LYFAGLAGPKDKEKGGKLQGGRPFFVRGDQ
jgi:hypothetical protein